MIFGTEWQGTNRQPDGVCGVGFDSSSIVVGKNVLHCFTFVVFSENEVVWHIRYWISKILHYTVKRCVVLNRGAEYCAVCSQSGAPFLWGNEVSGMRMSERHSGKEHIAWTVFCWMVSGRFWRKSNCEREEACGYWSIRVHRHAKFAQSTILCFQYLRFHDHTFNRAKSANYVISPGFHGQACHGQATEFSCPGFHHKQQNSLPMHCNEKSSWINSNSHIPLCGTRWICHKAGSCI